MKRKRSNSGLLTATIMAVLAIAIGVGVFVVWPKYAPEAGGEATPEPTEMPLFSAASDQVVTAFKVTNNDTQQTVAAELGDAGAQDWKITEAPEGTDTGLGVDSNRILQTVFSLPTLKPTRTLNQIEALAVYGLDHPHYTIEFTTNAGQTYTLNVGEKNPGGDAYYVRLHDTSSGVVYLISTYDLDGVIGFVDKPPYMQPTAEPSASPSEAPSDNTNG